MQRLKFINARGHEVVFAMEDPFVLWKIDGTGLPAVTPTLTQSVGQNGYTLHSVVLESRSVNVTGHVICSNGNVKGMYEARKKLLSVINPIYGLGRLIYENDFGRWGIPAFCSQTNYGEKNLFVQTLDISFECPQPFWEDVEYTSVGLAYVEGGLQFPLVTPGFFGTLGYRAVINNTGDSLVPLEIYIDGGSFNPTLTNKSTGEFIKVERTMRDFDKLYINTDPENTQVQLIRSDGLNETRENAYGYLSFDSNPFLLHPGENEIVFTSDEENKKVKVRMLYKLLYSGV